ncbi:MAG: ATP-dependent Clp protease ATP-binding subunit [Clostridia bacterium]|nr:ATP-dependent Clp protease ATP-binding subunit [Clostridia bacterium]
MDFRSRFSDNLTKALDLANRAAAEGGVSYVGSEHLIHAFLSMPDCSAYKVLVSEGISAEEYRDVFLHVLDESVTIEGLTTRTKEMFTRAVKFAEAASGVGAKAGTAHFLLAVLDYESCVAVRILKRLGGDPEALREKTEDAIRAAINRKQSGYDASPSSSFGGGDKSTQNQRDTTSVKDYGSLEKKKPSEKTERREKPAAKQKQSEKEKLLQYGVDLTERARRGKIDPVIGRKKEIEKVVQVLSRRTKNNPVLVGEPGVGKSAVAEGLALLIAEGEVPEQLYNKTVFSVDIPGMLAGARYRGDFEERLKELTEAVINDGDIVLFIDEIHTIVGAGSSADNTMDAANILKPMLARGDLQVVGATTIEEYRKYIEKDSALERRFTPVAVEEPTNEQTKEILKGLRSKYEEHHGIRISDEAIDAAVSLSSRYITDRYLPDKAIDLIDEAAARARIIAEDGGEEMASLMREAQKAENACEMHRQKGEYAEATAVLNEKKHIEERMEAVRRANSMARGADGRYVLGKEQVAAIVSARTNIPILKITQEEGEKLMRLEEDLHRRIIGQNEAVAAVAKAIRRARAGLKDPSRPIGSFIFVGPTGVGKTDLCKALAEAMFGSEEQMIRLDMSEYMEKQSISKLIGAAPGYVGYDDLQTGQLTDKVRSKPYCVILFDEIEKAHPDVFNLLLQILDDGRLTDNKGRTVSFKNAVIILTSNVGAAQAEKPSSGVFGFGGSLAEARSASDEKAYDEMKETITNALKERFRPEFLNRLDDVIVFHKLTEEEAERIAGKIIEGLSKRLFEQRGITLSVSNNALIALVKEGYDSRYGARPLKRVIQRRVEDKLSEDILLGKIAGGERISVDYQGGEYTFTRL